MDPRFDEKILQELAETPKQLRDLRFLGELNELQTELIQATTEGDVIRAQRGIEAFLSMEKANIENLRKFANAYNHIHDQLTTLSQIDDEIKRKIPAAYFHPQYKEIVTVKNGNKYSPIDFINNYQKLIEAKQKEIVSKTKKVAIEEPSLTKSPPISQRGRGATSPLLQSMEPPEKKEEKKGTLRSKTLSAPNLKQEEETTVEFRNPFLNYRLNEIVKEKNIKLIMSEKNSNLVDEINNAILKNENFDKSYKDLEKLGIRLDKNTRAEIEQINKQVYYYSQIINPEVVKLLAGSAYLKSTKTFLLRQTSTLSQIEALNATIFTKETEQNKQFDEVKNLLSSIGLAATTDQIKAVLDENAELRRKADAEPSVNSNSNKDKLNWLKEEHKQPLTPSFLASPKDIITRNIDNVIANSSGNFVIKQTLQEKDPGTFNAIKNALLAAIKIAIINHNSAAKDHPEKKIPQPKVNEWVDYDTNISHKILEWVKSQKQDFTLSDLVKVAISAALPSPSKDVEKALVASTQQALAISFKPTPTNTSYKHFKNLSKIEFAPGEDTNAVYKALNDLVDNNIALPDYTWQILLLLQNVKLDSERLQLLTDKLIRENKSDYVDALLRNEKVDQKDKFTIYQKTLSHKLSNPAARIQLFLQTQEAALTQRQTEILSKLEVIKDKLDPHKYQELVSGLKAEREKFNLRFKSPKEIQTLASELIAEKAFPTTSEAEAIIAQHKDSFKKEKPMLSVEEQEEKKARQARELNGRTAELYSYLANFANSMSKFIDYLYDKDGNLTFAKLRKKVEGEGNTVTYAAIDPLSPDQHALFEVFLQPFKQLKENLLKFKPENNEEAIDYFINKLESDPVFTQALIDATANQDNVNKFLSRNNIYGFQEGEAVVNGFNDYAIKPAQVATKLYLILTDAIKHIPEQDPLYKKVEKGLIITTKLPNTANEIQRARAVIETKEQNHDDLVKSINNYKKLLIEKINLLQLENKDNFISIVNELANTKEYPNDVWLYKTKNILAVLAQLNSADEMRTYLNKLIGADTDITKAITERSNASEQATNIIKLAKFLQENGAKLIHDDVVENKRESKEDIHIETKETQKQEQKNTEEEYDTSKDNNSEFSASFQNQLARDFGEYDENDYEEEFSSDDEEEQLGEEEENTQEPEQVKKPIPTPYTSQPTVPPTEDTKNPNPYNKMPPVLYPTYSEMNLSSKRPIPFTFTNVTPQPNTNEEKTATNPSPYGTITVPSSQPVEGTINTPKQQPNPYAHVILPAIQPLDNKTDTTQPVHKSPYGPMKPLVFYQDPNEAKRHYGRIPNMFPDDTQEKVKTQIHNPRVLFNPTPTNTASTKPLQNMHALLFQMVRTLDAMKTSLEMSQAELRHESKPVPVIEQPVPPTTVNKEANAPTRVEYPSTQPQNIYRTQPSSLLFPPSPPQTKKKLPPGAKPLPGLTNEQGEMPRPTTPTDKNKK